MDTETAHTARNRNELTAMTPNELELHLKSLIKNLQQHTAIIAAEDNLDSQSLLMCAQALASNANELSIVATKFTDNIDKQIARKKISERIRLNSGPFIPKHRED